VAAAGYAPARASVVVTTQFRTDQDLALASGPAHPTADASFSGGVFSDGGSDFGTSTTVPAAMLDGITTSGGWSNRYSKAATQTLPQITNSHPEDWVSIGWPDPQRFDRLNVYFTLDANNQLPATTRVTYWNGLSWVPVTGQRVMFASASNQPSTISFDPISTTRVKLDMTSRSPNDPVTGNLTISEIEIPGTEVGSS
jgi:beta-galactosidase